MNINKKIVGKVELGASSGPEGWKDVLQLLKDRNEKMEKLARALSVIQNGMLRNNPGIVKDSVNEAAEVLGGMLNTHRCLLESGVELQKRLETHPAPIKDGDWQVVAQKKKKKKVVTERRSKDPVQEAQGTSDKSTPKRSSPARSGDAIKVSAKDGQSYADILKEMKAKVETQ